MISWQSLSLGLHLWALALWLGGMIFFLVVFAPAFTDLEPGVAMRMLNHARKSLEAIAWTGIGLLLITGVVNLVLRRQASPAGLGQFYLLALSIKLMLFGAMLYHHGLQVFKYGAQIAALTAATSPEAVSWPEPLRVLWQRWLTLLKVNATLGPIATLMGLVLLKS